MLRRRLLWSAKCLLFCLGGIFVAGRVAELLNPLVWWALHQSGATALGRPSFLAAYYLTLIGIYGFALGLVPIHRLQELGASTFGRFHWRSSLHPEMIWSRPLLWAWVPVGLVLLVRFVTFPLGREHSVLESTASGENRYEHFFAPLDLHFAPDPSAWIFDRLLLTSPTLFLLAYTLGVWLRHQFPKRTSSPAETPEITTD